MLARNSRPEWRLLLLLLIELTIFNFLAPSFLTGKNAAEIARLSVEIGLLVLAQTCVIVTGGIDLSVGSMMGLAAVALGWLWRDAHVPLGAAVVLTLCLGALGGLLNAQLITRLRTLPLIVTLGTYSLFRGLAEGLTEGVQNYTGFPASFLFLGQGYWFGIPPQLLDSDCRGHRLLAAARTLDNRPLAFGDRLLRRRLAPRRSSCRRAVVVGLCSFRVDGEPCRRYLCGASGPGEIGRGDRLRADRDYRRRARRHFHLRRPR